MSEFVILRDLAIIFGVAVAVVALLHRIGIPSIAGFILVGVLIGPQALGVIDNLHDIEILAEIGVVLLLFSIGSEFSLKRLHRLWLPILIGGTFQVTVTIAITFTVALLFGYPWPISLFAGFLFSLSSTAIALRGLSIRGEIDAPHGRLALGILLFQDIIVIPMMLVIPFLSDELSSGWSVVTVLIRTLAILFVILFAVKLIVPPLFQFIARTRERDLFVLTVLLVSIGTAWAATLSGISLALGAFLAGLVVAGSEFRRQAIAELIPFREGFTSLFFISVGMLLSPIVFIDNWHLILAILMALLVMKFIVVIIAGILVGLSLRASVLAASAIAQVGEFSFVLANAAKGTGLFEGPLSECVMAAAILSMMITPFVLSFGPKLAAGVGKMRVINSILKVKTSEDAAQEQSGLKDHVIIGGYGYVGQQLSQALRQCGIPHVIAGLNIENVRKANDRGETAYFGDITSEEVLENLGVKNARELVLTINDPHAIEQAVEAARRIAPDVYITVRARFRLDVSTLLTAGANKVFPDEIEAAAQVVSHILKRHQVETSQIDPIVVSIQKKKIS